MIKHQRSTILQVLLYLHNRWLHFIHQIGCGLKTSPMKDIIDGLFFCKGGWSGALRSGERAVFLCARDNVFRGETCWLKRRHTIPRQSNPSDFAIIYIVVGCICWIGDSCIAIQLLYNHMTLLAGVVLLTLGVAVAVNAMIGVACIMCYRRWSFFVVF